MTIGRKLDLDQLLRSFKKYLRIIIFDAKSEAKRIRNSEFATDDEYDLYADSFYIVDKNEEFEMLLTCEEYNAIRYFQYHNPIDKQPNGFDGLFINAFRKWCFVFFARNENDYVKVDTRTLGALMRLFREKDGKSKTAMGDILGVDRTAIGFYEDGKRMPSINYLYRFCKYFKISIDELLEKSLNQKLK